MYVGDSPLFLDTLALERSSPDPSDIKTMNENLWPASNTSCSLSYN